MTDVARQLERHRGIRRALGIGLARPTLIAQGVSALASLLLVALVTRTLTTTDFAVYSTVFATYALGNALVGTSVGTRLIEAISAHGRARIELSVVGDVSALLLCAGVAAATTLITKTDGLVALAAALGMLGMLVAELGNAYLLGQRRYWMYAGLTLLRMAVWVTAAFVAVALVPRADRLAPALLAVAVASLVPLIYVTSKRAWSISWRRAGAGVAVSSIGVANLALWILASADRLILANYALAALATYAALYGLLDRVFRSIANAEAQQQLPNAFREVAGGGRPRLVSSWRVTALLSGVGITCAFLGPWAVGVISGGTYNPSIAMSTILAAAMIMMLLAVPTYVGLMALKRTRACAAIAITAAAVNIGGNFVLDPIYGTMAAAWLTLAGYAIWFCGVNIVARTPSRESVRTAGDATA